MRLSFEIAGNQIDGARDYQEDAFLSSFLDNPSGDGKSSALVIMADGMGGHAAGNIASNLVVSTFNKSFTSGFTDETDVTNALRVSLAKANGALSESIRETPALDGMGCTMVAGIFHTGKCWWISVGDSHLYLVRDRELNKKNEDHSYGGYLDRMSAQGMDVEPEPGLSRNMLMSAMTGDDIAEIDCPSTAVQLLPGDRLIVASDGLDSLTDGTIIQMCAWSSTAKECVDALLKAVEDAAKPRQDNTTVIVVDVHDKDEGVVAAPPGARDSGKKEIGPGDTQPISLEAIAEVLEEPPALQGKRDQGFNKVEEDDDEGISVVRVIVAILILLLLLGGIAGGAYWYFFMRGAEPLPATTTTATTATTETAEVEPSSTGDSATTATTTTTKPTDNTGNTVTTASQSDEQNIVSGFIDTTSSGEAESASGVTDTQSSDANSSSSTKPTAAQSNELPQLRDELSSGEEGPTIVVISPGSFKMGSNLFDKPDESPRHGVSINGFGVGQTEITQAQYTMFAKATKRRIPASGGGDPETTPVVNVSWDDAHAYAQWLSNETGEVYRLLSESEWEYAASGGNSAPFWWGFDFESGRAHCFNCGTKYSTKRPAPVKSFDPNRFGLYDTAGNVLEWVQDCYHSNYSGAPSDSSVWQGGDCSKRIVRGGAYNTPSDSLRSQKRAAFLSTKGRRNIGFRIAREF